MNSYTTLHSEKIILHMLLDTTIARAFTLYEQLHEAAFTVDAQQLCWRDWIIYKINLDMHCLSERESFRLVALHSYFNTTVQF